MECLCGVSASPGRIGFWQGTGLNNMDTWKTFPPCSIDAARFDLSPAARHMVLPLPLAGKDLWTTEA